MKNNGIVLMMSDSYGVYIPHHFLDCRIGWHGIAPEDAEIIAQGPDHEWYWEAWDSVLNNAFWIDAEGHRFTLHQDGDLWAICPDLMTNEEYQNFFGEIKPAPDNAYEFEFCGDCIVALGSGDYSGMDDEQ